MSELWELLMGADPIGIAAIVSVAAGIVGAALALFNSMATRPALAIFGAGLLFVSGVVAGRFLLWREATPPSGGVAQQTAAATPTIPAPQPGSVHWIQGNAIEFDQAPSGLKWVVLVNGQPNWVQGNTFREPQGVGFVEAYYQNDQGETSLVLRVAPQRSAQPVQPAPPAQAQPVQ